MPVVLQSALSSPASPLPITTTLPTTLLTTQQPTTQQQTQTQTVSNQQQQQQQQSHVAIKRSVIIPSEKSLRSKNLLRKQLKQDSRQTSNGSPANAYVELLVVTDTTVFNNFVTLAGTSDMNIVFSNMGIYYANAINAVFLNH
jgi:hypothetical protein